MGTNIIVEGSYTNALPNLGLTDLGFPEIDGRVMPAGVFLVEACGRLRSDDRARASGWSAGGDEKKVARTELRFVRDIAESANVSIYVRLREVLSRRLSDLARIEKELELVGQRPKKAPTVCTARGKLPSRLLKRI